MRLGRGVRRLAKSIAGGKRFDDADSQDGGLQPCSDGPAELKLHAD
jgi:hypothetical protein